MATRVEELEAQKRALPAGSLLPAYRLDDATRKRYKNLPVQKGVAYTKAEQLNLREAVDTSSEMKVRASS